MVQSEQSGETITQRVIGVSSAGAIAVGRREFKVIHNINSEQIKRLNSSSRITQECEVFELKLIE